MMKTFKKTLLVNAILLLAIFSLNGQHIDRKACKLFNSHLRVIKKTVFGTASVKINDIMMAIEFLEKVTSIKSKSDGNIIGRYNPTMDDFKNWSDWYKMNKSRLYWDDGEKQVKVKAAP